MSSDSWGEDGFDEEGEEEETWTNGENLRMKI